MSDFRMSPAPDEPPAPFQQEKGPPYQNYSNVPYLRLSGTNTVFILIHILSGGTIPLLLITCIVLVTGNVYYNRHDEQGNLKVWSTANKVIAFGILTVTSAYLGYILVLIATSSS